MDYYPWLKDDEDESFAWIWGAPRELMETDYLLQRGTPCEDWFPKDLVFELSKDHGVKLTDSIPNTDQFLLVSEKLKGLLEQRAPGVSIEFLPIRLRNQKKKLVAKKYFLANVLGTVGCVDTERSDFKMSSIDKSQVHRFYRLVLDEKKIPDEARLFRLAEDTGQLIIREDLAQDILNADCTGMMFIPLEDFGAEFRGRS